MLIDSDGKRPRRRVIAVTSRAGMKQKLPPFGLSTWLLRERRLSLRFKPPSLGSLDILLAWPFFLQLVEHLNRRLFCLVFLYLFSLLTLRALGSLRGSYSAAGSWYWGLLSTVYHLSFKTPQQYATPASVPWPYCSIASSTPGCLSAGARGRSLAPPASWFWFQGEQRRSSAWSMSTIVHPCRVIPSPVTVKRTSLPVKTMNKLIAVVADSRFLARS